MKNFLILAAAACTALAAAAAPRAQGAPGRKSSAMIADVAGSVAWEPARKASPDLLDEVYPGDKLRVRKDSLLVLVYYDNCRKETIAGPATARVGKVMTSVPPETQVQVSQARCERRKAVLPPGAGKSAQGLVVAKVEYKRAASKPAPLEGSSPENAPVAPRDGGFLEDEAPGSPPVSSSRGKKTGGWDDQPAPPGAPPGTGDLSPVAEELHAKETRAPGGAREEYKRAVAKDPRDTAARLAYAAFLENKGELQEALLQYQLVLEIRPDSAALRRRCEKLRALLSRGGK